MPELASLRRSSRAAICLECGKCSALCPLAHGATDFSAARMVAIHELDRDRWGRGLAAAQRCLTCGACEVRCPQQVSFTSFVLGLRSQLPDDCRSSCPHGQVLQAASRLMAEQRPAVDRRSWLGDGLRVAEEGPLAVFVGCLPLFDLQFSEELGVDLGAIARSAIRLMNALGVEPVVLADERCCGHDLLWSGDRGGFTALAAANLELFQGRGVEHVVCLCAECCRTWRLDYPEVAAGGAPKVEHIAEFLARHLDGGSAELFEEAAATVTFQDPCRLARHLDVVEAPRQVLAAVPGAELAEMERSGRDAVCCGTAGFVRCDAESRRLQTERLAAAAETGADTLLTACPKCLIHFACAQYEEQRLGVPPEVAVEDLVVWAANRLRSTGGEPLARSGDPV